MKVPAVLVLAAAALSLAAPRALADPVDVLHLGDTVSGTVEEGTLEVFPFDAVEGTALDVTVKMGAGAFPRVAVLQPDRSLLPDTDLFAKTDAAGRTFKAKKIPLAKSGRHFLLLQPQVPGAYTLQVKGKLLRKTGYAGFVLPDPPVEVRFGAVPGATVSVTVKQAKGSALAPKLLALLGPDGAPVDLAGAKKHVFNGKADVYQDVPLALLGEYLVRCGTQSGLYGDTGVVSISLKFPVFKKAKLPDSDLVVHPYVDDVTPSSGFDNRSYAAVVVEGDFFAPGPAVRLEGPATRDAAAVSRLSDDLLSVDLDLVGLPAGTYDLVVSYANGAVGREVGGFTVLPTPLPAGITPSGAFDNRPQPFVVTGSRFQGGLAAAVVPAGGGSPVAGTVGATTDTTFSVTFPLLDAPLGSFDLVVTNPDGGTNTLAACLDVARGPRLTAVAPLLGYDNDAARAVFLSGQYFQAGLSCTLEKAGSATLQGAVTALTGGSATATFDLRGKAAGNWTVRVTHPDGGTLAWPAPLVLSRAPRVATISKDRGLDVETVAGVTVTGTDMVAGAQATLEAGGSTRCAATGEAVGGGGTSLGFDLPFSPGSGGLHDLRVTNPDGGSEVLAGAFHVLGTVPLASGVSAAGGPSFAYNAEDDEYLVVWSEGDGTQWDVRARRHSGRTGAAVGSAIAITDASLDPSSSTDQVEPSAIYVPDLELYAVIYAYRDPAAATYKARVLVQFVRRDGTLEGTQEYAHGIAAYSGGTVASPRIAWNPDRAEWFAVWAWDADGYADVWYSCLTDNRPSPALHYLSPVSTGALVQTTHTVVDGGETLTIQDGDAEPDLAWDPTNGEYVVAWTFDVNEVGVDGGDPPADSGTDVRAMFLDGDLSSGPVVRATLDALASTADRDERHPRLAAGAGALLLAWDYEAGASNRDVRAQVLDPAARAAVGAGPTTVEGTASEDAAFPSAAFDPDAAGASWVVAHALAPGASGTSSIRATRFPVSASSSTGLGTPVRTTLAPALAGAAYAAPEVATRGGTGGEFLAGWPVAGTAKAPADSEIRFTR